MNASTRRLCSVGPAGQLTCVCLQWLRRGTNRRDATETSQHRGRQNPRKSSRLDDVSPRDLVKRRSSSSSGSHHARDRASSASLARLALGARAIRTTMTRPSRHKARFMWSMAVGNVVRILAVVAFACLADVGFSAQSGIGDAAQLDPIARSRGPAVLIFLRTDCPISQRYAPTIQPLAAKYAGQATFWLVFPARNDSVAMIADHTREYGYTLAAIRDPDQRLVRRAKATTTPEAAVFDATGALRYHGRL